MANIEIPDNGIILNNPMFDLPENKPIKQDINFLVNSTLNIDRKDIKEQRTSCGNCVFPFVAFGRIHDRCTTILGTSPFCATTSNYDQDGQFEWCTQSTCPGVAPPTETMTVSPGNEVGSCCKYKTFLDIFCNTN